MRRDAESIIKPLSDNDLASRLDAAVARRAALIGSGASNAVRLVHDVGDGLSGIVIEKFASTLIVQHHEGRAVASVEQLAPPVESLMTRVGAESAYLKRFVRDRSMGGYADDRHHMADPWMGTPAEEEFAINENGIHLLIRPFDGFSTGLFLEHRDNRARVQSLAAGKSVLNLFAYTCGFSVAAALGGAEEVTSVDLSPRYLDWGRRNFAVNNLNIEEHRFIRDDSLNFYERARRQERDYDLIVIDPPTFARIKKPKSVFVLADRIDAVLGGAVGRLRRDGKILFATNDRRLPHKVIEAAFHTASAKRRVLNIEWLAMPPDFQGDPDFARAVLVTIR
ncbi:MAG: class I SAM-dependent rRNA methyltransferase [Phycisphaerales bacterium]|nr:class I SAM-dependent rRNA methyltransferase [Phycisphaerales bacterium]MCB9864176.1 class I SAM-dependent rRNA methyltransferase [Phycisphaerales bacterium]